MESWRGEEVGVDADGRAITPCYTYADSRCSAQVSYLRSILDEGGPAADYRAAAEALRPALTQLAEATDTFILPYAWPPRP